MDEIPQYDIFSLYIISRSNYPSFYKVNKSSQTVLREPYKVRKKLWKCPSLGLDYFPKRPPPPKNKIVAFLEEFSNFYVLLPLDGSLSKQLQLFMGRNIETYQTQSGL